MSNPIAPESPAKSPEQGIIIQNIEIRPVVRISQDIVKWRNAMQMAEAMNPIRVPLYDLYDDMLLDGTLKDLYDKRVLGVTKARLKFVNSAGEEVPEMDKLIKKRQFRKLRKEITRSKFWGIGCMELMVKDGQFKVYVIPRKHIQPKAGKIVYEQYGQSGFFYRQPPYNKYVLEVGEWNDLGLFLQAAQYVIYKRGAFGDWAQFAQIFGMPFREAKYDGYNEEVRRQLINAMEEAGAASYIITPAGAEFKLHPTGNTQSNGELYNALRKACNEELAVLILGQTETTTKTAGKLGGNDDTHEKTEDDINQDDRDDELSILNESVLPILANLGYPVEGGEFIYEPVAEKLTLKDRVDIVVKAKTVLQTPVDDDYVYELTGIPKPKNYDQLKQEQNELQSNEEADDEEDTPKPPAKGNKKSQPAPAKPGKKKLSAWHELRLKMADFFDRAPAS